MSYQLVDSAIFYDGELTCIERMTLVILAAHADLATGSCYPSVQRVADLAGVSRPSVTLAIKRLSEVHKIIVIKRNFIKRAKTTNTYTFNLKTAKKKSSLSLKPLVTESFADKALTKYKAVIDASSEELRQNFVNAFNAMDVKSRLKITDALDDRLSSGELISLSSLLEA